MSSDSKSLSFAGLNISSAIRAGLSSAPFTGGVAALWSEWDTSRRFARVEEALAQLTRRLMEYGSAFSPNRLGDAEMQLLEDGLARISREHRDWKRRCFVELLASNWVNTAAPFDERALFHRALDVFDKIHIRILRILADRNQRALEPIHVNDLYNEALGGSVTEEVKYGIFLPAMTMLATEYGFMRRRGISTGEYLRDANSDDLTFHAKCLLLPRGKSYIESLSKADPDAIQK
jgi:hypothetical protein